MAILPVAGGWLWTTGVSVSSHFAEWTPSCLLLTLRLRYGTFVFNGLLQPLCFKPPTGIQLPNESGLEETGEVPAASTNRAGYDVVPSSERD